MPVMGLGGLLEPGLRSEAAFIYRPMYQGVKDQIGDVIWMEATSDKLQEVWGFLETGAYLTWWPAETPPPAATIKSQRFRILNIDFGRRVYLPRNSDDDQTGSAMAVARQIAENAALLPQEIFFQIITGTAYDGRTAPFPNTSIFTEADGSGVYSSSTRYGSSSGNVVSVSGTSTVQQVITDIFSAHRRFCEFLNTQNRPFFNPQQTKKLSIFYGSQLVQVMSAAYMQTRVPWEQTTGSNGTGQTPSNLLQDSKFDLRFINSSTYISDTKYYLFVRDLPTYMRPLWRQVRKGYTEWQGNFVTSDHSRDSGQVYIQSDVREGYGGALAIGTIRVS